MLNPKKFSIDLWYYFLNFDVRLLHLIHNERVVVTEKYLSKRVASFSLASRILTKQQKCLPISKLSMFAGDDEPEGHNERRHPQLPPAVPAVHPVHRPPGACLPLGKHPGQLDRPLPPPLTPPQERLHHQPQREVHPAFLWRRVPVNTPPEGSASLKFIQQP